MPSREVPLAAAPFVACKAGRPRRVSSTAAGQDTVAAEETAARAVSVRQKQGARALVRG